MKHLIQQIILLIFYLVFIDFVQASQTSVCHTDSPYYDLLVEKDGIYLQETIKAENKISYIAQSKIRLKEITDKGARIISDDGDRILVLSNAKYFFIPKHLYRTINQYKITSLFNENEVSKIVSNKFFLVSGNWYYASYALDGESYKHKIPELKGNLEIIAVAVVNNKYLGRFNHFWSIVLKDDEGYQIILKDDNAVYVYDISKNKLEKIPHLTPSQTHLIQSRNTPYYLYDDDTFYLIDKDYKYTDITEEFNLQGKYNGFTKAEMHTNWSGDSMDTKDGLIWIKIFNSFKPVKATYLNAYKDLYVYHNKVYSHNWALQDEAAPSDPSYRDGSIDISNVKNPGELHKISSSEYFDNQQYYSLEENSRRLEKKEPSAYLKLLTTKDDIEIREKRIFIDGQQLNTDKFQDAPIFLGSIVDIISPCVRIMHEYYHDETYDSKEDYYYFFTDGKKVYAYINPRENQKPKVLHNVSPRNLKANDYDTLKKLLNILLPTAKKND
ncbi:hypothetical protein ACQP6C_08510 [Snodgrassella alvi]|uniref:hypothetical protein n=1 Tax=Snodgrassella alvi TaxID=1196083 RepID=UPI003D08ED7F